MEISTIVLAILRADFFDPTMQIIMQASFAVLFFLSRIVLSPYIYYGIIYEMNKKLGECFPTYIYYVTLLFGGFFHALNLWWFTKMVQKIKKKLSGKESLKVDKELKMD